jgi:hypothetical protein
MDDRLDPERADQDRIKADTIARVLHGLDFVAFAPGTNDWDSGGDGLTKLANTSGGVAIVAIAKPSAPFASIALRQVGGVKVGFVGYGQPEGSVPKSPGEVAAGTPNAEEAVQRGADEARRLGANVLVALVSVGRGEAKRIADAVPELTAVVIGSAKASGDGNTSGAQGEQVGDVLVVQAANHLQSVAVLDLYVRESVVPGHLVKFADATGLELARRREELTRRADELHVKIAAWERDRSVHASDLEARRRELANIEAQRDALDERPPPTNGSFFRYALKEIRVALGKDSAIQAEMLAYYKAVDDHNRVAFAQRLPPPPAPDQASYIGIDACSTCHPEPRQVWDRTSHARAYATLSSQFKEFNLECVSCHVTGYEKPAGSTVTHVDKLQDVQCEVCHGPGSKHALAPLDRTLIVAKPDPSTCIGCHHPPHVEQFDAFAKTREILGPGHGMPLK